MYYPAPPKFLTNKSETNWCHFLEESKELWYFSPLCLSVENNSAGKKW